MEILIIIAGILNFIRAFWVINLINKSNGVEKISFIEFFGEAPHFQKYLFRILLIWPYFRFRKDKKLQLLINLVTVVIYILIGGYIYSINHPLSIAKF